MNVTIIGTGFVGVVSCAVFASFGNTVIGLDIDPKRIASLKQGKVPFYEPGLEDLLKKTQTEGSLSFTTDYKEAICKADIIMIAVGTPSAADGQADLSYVFTATKNMAPFLKEGVIVAIKSTVPPGTCQKVKERIQDSRSKIRSTKAYVVSLPEFLREGTAVQDTLHPDRVIIGATEPEIIDRLQKLHEPFNAAMVVMNPESAQMCKYTANAYLATRITFINQIANLCEVNGASILEVVRGIGQDKRIGSHYWYPGLGYGGSCFPKDVKELAAYARSVGQESNLMVTVNELNEERIPMLMERFTKTVGDWRGKKVAVLGLSFKPNTDDMREAPSLRVIPWLLQKGARVYAYDPISNEVARNWFGRIGITEDEGLHLTNSLQEVTSKADVIILLIEWEEFKVLNLHELAQVMNANAVFIDTRDQYVKAQVEEVGIQYIGVGV